MATLLFIAPADLGEAILSTAALNQVLTPETAVTIVCAADAAPLFRATPGLTKIHVAREGGSFVTWLVTARRFANARFDLVLDLSGRRAAYAVRARRRIVRGSARVLRHRVEDFAALLGAERLQPRLWLDDAARADAAVAEGGPFLALAVGAQSAGMHWPSEHFAAVARRLVSGAGPLAGARVIVLGDPEYARAIAASLDADGVSAVDLAGQVDLLSAAALLERATLLIADDNALMHAGAAMGAPTLGLFGPSDERVRGPFGPRARALRGRPFAEIMAATHAGLDDRAPMEDVSVDAVEAAALELLHAGGLS